MSTTGSSKHGSLNVPDRDASEVSAPDHTSREAPEAQENQCGDGVMCEEESKAQTHERSLVVVDQDMMSRAHSTIHSVEMSVQSEEVLHSNDGIRQTIHESDIEVGLASESVCENPRSGIEECLFAVAESSLKKPCRVAVTGAGGFIASWIVKLLLQRGFYVRGTLRNIDDENTAHLRSLEGASERLELLKANILHLPHLVAVVEGCEGVFHTACPVLPTISDPELMDFERCELITQAQMLRPAVEGTLNVLRACAQARVKRVVMTSSIGAVYMNPNRSPEQEFDESSWSDENYLKDIKEWYCLAKLVAERTAWEYAKTHNVNLVTICPGVTLGTMLQPRVNQSSIHILKYLNGSTKTYANLCQAYVDVEDTAEAHVLAFVTPTAHGRYLCCKWSRHRGEVVDALARMCPHYPIPTRCKDEGQPRTVALRFCNRKVEQLGLRFTSFDRTLRHAVTSLQAKGILQNHTRILNVEDHAQSSKCTGSKSNNGAVTPTATAVLFPTDVQTTQLVITQVR